ncbi:MAG: SocA family protein [candidate division Zixibacteria bacterium]|nr:SocA family protein [Candidatus Tariuqbacter arcticus]
MTYEAKAVANYFLDLAWSKKEEISPMKMQKLIYYAHGWHLAIYDKPLLNELIEAWRYGPVIPSVYHEFKEFGNEQITKYATDFDIENFSFNPPHLPEDAKIIPLLKKIWEIYGKFKAIKLSNMTHQPGTPWAETWGNDGVPENTNIEDKLIKKYFVSLARRKKNG